MVIARIAFRNILRQKRRSLLTGLMMVGGFVLASISLGISDGSYSHLIELFTRDRTGHVQIHKRGYLDRPSLYKTLEEVEEIGAQLVAEGEVQAWAPRVYSPVLAFRGTKTTGGQVVGVDPLREGRTTRLSGKVGRGRFIGAAPVLEVVVGEGLAEILGARLGDEIALIAQGADGSVANDVFAIVGLVQGGVQERMNCYMHLETAQEFLALQGRVHEVAVVLEDQVRARQVAVRLQVALGEDFAVDPWQVVEKAFYEAMRADVEGMWVSLLVIMVIVAIGVLNTVLMTILERTREFGVLRALGTRPSEVFKLVVLETACLAALSAVVGAALGLLCNYLLSLHGIPLPESITYGGVTFDRMIGRASAQSVWLPALVTWGTAVAVSLIPAWRAARLQPVEAMRMH